MEERLAELGPIGMDVEVVKQQLTELRAFKDLVHPKHLDIQSLNSQAQDLTRDSPTEQGMSVREPMSDVNKRWDALIDSISERKVSRLIRVWGQDSKANKDYQVCILLEYIACDEGFHYFIYGKQLRKCSITWVEN